MNSNGFVFPPIRIMLVKLCSIIYTLLPFDQSFQRGCHPGKVGSDTKDLTRHMSVDCLQYMIMNKTPIFFNRPKRSLIQ